MTDPVDTDALRATARKAGAAIAAAALNAGRIQMRVPADPDSDTDLLVATLECDALAAADEVDRLRAKVADQRRVNASNIETMTGVTDRLRAEMAKLILDTREATRTAQYERERAQGYEREMNGLVAVIENAPHAINCKRGGSGNLRVPCTCWKADAL